MASYSSFSIFATTLLALSTFIATNAAPPPDTMLTIVNNCPFTIFPAIQPNTGLSVLANGGFTLAPNGIRSFPVPPQPWSGRVWARTGCASSPTGLTCATGDCGGRLECGGFGGAPPASLAQFSLHQGDKDVASYDVSLIDGYNLPMTVTPHEGQGICPVVGCTVDLLPSCPENLQYRIVPGGPVVGCKSGCGAYGTDDLCCKNGFAAPQACKPSGYSQFFKNTCPATYTYAQDTPSLAPQCSSPKELKVIFCH